MVAFALVYNYPIMDRECLLGPVTAMHHLEANLLGLAHEDEGTGGNSLDFRRVTDVVR